MSNRRLSSDTASGSVMPIDPARAEHLAALRFEGGDPGVEKRHRQDFARGEPRAPGGTVEQTIAAEAPAGPGGTQGGCRIAINADAYQL